MWSLQDFRLERPLEEERSVTEAVSKHVRFILVTMGPLEQLTQPPLDYRSQIVAGYNWSPSMYIFSSDDRQLFIPSGSTVRVYSTEDASFVRSLPDNDDDLLKLRGDTNVSIQLHPYCPSKYILCFTSGRKLVIISLETGGIVYYEDLFHQIKLPPEELGQNLDFGGCILTSAKKSKHCLLYYGVKSHFKFYEKELSFPFNDGKKAKIKSQVRRIFLVDEGKIDRITLHKSSALTLSESNKFIAMINGRALYVHTLPAANGFPHLHLKLDNEFTCIASHPKEELLATGDSIGVITIWRNFTQSSKPDKSNYHWHPQPVSCLAFSSLGSRLFSGCAVGKLISWLLDNPGVHSEVANLGIPIRGIGTDSGNQRISVSLVDGTIKLIRTNATSHKKDIVNVLENSVSQVDIELNLKKPIFDSVSKSILIKGFNGTLQFFSLASNSVARTLDITNTNYHQNFDSGPQAIAILLNNLAISLDGKWLATDELTEESEFLFEEKLKFWSLNSQSSHELTNFFDLPHDKPISDMRFSPDASVLVSISSDTYFKVWRKKTDAVDGSQAFILSQAANRGLSMIPLSLSISSDSSILTVQYENELSCWDISRDQVCPLENLNEINSDWNDPLVAFDFAGGTAMHMFLAVRRSTVRNFNFVRGCHEWTITNEQDDEKNVSFSLDHSQNIFAVHRSTHVISIYHVNPQKLVGVISNDILAPIGKMSSILTLNLSSFVDSSHDYECDGSIAILCVNKRKQLVSLLPRQFVVKKLAPPDDSTDTVDENSIKIVGKIIANHHALPIEYASQKRRIEMQFDHDKLVEDYFLQDATHLLAPVNLLCKQFLKSLFLQENLTSDQKKTKR